MMSMISMMRRQQQEKNDDGDWQITTSECATTIYFTLGSVHFRRSVQDSRKARSAAAASECATQRWLKWRRDAMTSRTLCVSTALCTAARCHPRRSDHTRSRLRAHPPCDSNRYALLGPPGAAPVTVPDNQGWAIRVIYHSSTSPKP